MDDDVPVETVRGLAGPDRRHYSMDARDGWDSGSAQSLSRGGAGKGERRKTRRGMRQQGEKEVAATVGNKGVGGPSYGVRDREESSMAVDNGVTMDWGGERSGGG